MPPKGVLGMPQNILLLFPPLGVCVFGIGIQKNNFFIPNVSCKQVDQPTCTTPKKQAITVPSLASIEELRTPSFDDLVVKMKSEANKTKVENGDINQQPCLLSPRSPLTTINWLSNRYHKQWNTRGNVIYHRVPRPKDDEDCSEQMKSGRCRQDLPLTADNATGKQRCFISRFSSPYSSTDVGGKESLGGKHH